MSVRNFISVEQLQAAKQRKPVQRLFKGTSWSGPKPMPKELPEKPKCAHKSCAGKDCLCKCHGGTYVQKSMKPSAGPIADSDLPAHFKSSHGTRDASMFNGRQDKDGMGRKIDLAKLHDTDHRMWQRDLSHTHRGPKSIADGQEKLKMSLAKKPPVVHECPHCGEMKAGRCEHSTQRSHADDTDQLGMEKGRLPNAYTLTSQKTGRTLSHYRGNSSMSSVVYGHGGNESPPKANPGMRYGSEYRGYSNASAGRVQRMAQRSTGPVGKVRQMFGAPKIHTIAKSGDELPTHGPDFEKAASASYDPQPMKKLKKPQATRKPGPPKVYNPQRRSK